MSDQKILDYFNQAQKEYSISIFKYDSQIELIENKKIKLEILQNNIESHNTAASFIQSIIETVCDSNLRKIEKWVNLGLCNIFYDQDVQFKIIKGISRNTNIYSFVIMKDGVEGSLNSFGGGILCVISLILKILFLELTKSHKLLVLDESLSFLSEAYIENCAKFINTLVSEFKLNVILVTHQEKFKNYTNLIYQAKSKQGQTIFEHYETA